MKHILVALGLILALLPQAVQAQTKDRLTTRGTLLGWEAVGRLDMPGGQCTGTLIARDLVLTAAHCVINSKTGQPFTRGEMSFHAGFAYGKSFGSQKIKRLVADPGYRHSRTGKISGEMMRHDVALLQLEAPIFEPNVDPFAVYDGTPDANEVILASYGRGRSEAITLERGCNITETYTGGIIGFDCDATFGSSGAPVFTRDMGRLRILSIISGGNKTEAFGMSLPQKVAQLKVRIRNARPIATATAKRLTAGSRTEGGARFVKAPGS